MLYEFDQGLTCNEIPIVKLKLTLILHIINDSMSHTYPNALSVLHKFSLSSSFIEKAIIMSCSKAIGNTA